MEVQAKNKGLMLAKGLTTNWTNCVKPAEWNHNPTDFRVEALMSTEELREFTESIREGFDSNRAWLLETKDDINPAQRKKLMEIDPLSFFDDKEVFDEDGNGTGQYKIKFKRSIKAGPPKLVTASKEETDVEPGRGAVVNVLFRPQAYAAGANVGIKLALEAVQIIERNAAPGTEDMFDEEEGFENPETSQPADSLPEEDNF